MFTEFNISYNLTRRLELFTEITLIYKASCVLFLS